MNFTYTFICTTFELGKLIIQCKLIRKKKKDLPALKF